MKVGIFGGAEYPLGDGWPLSPGKFEPEDTTRAWDEAMEIFEMADELGLDHVSVAEHHYSNRLDANPLITAAVLAQRLKRAKIAVLGRTAPLANPVLLAEELAMLDVIAQGRLIVALFRGTPNEYVTYYTNPTESRDMMVEAVELIRAAWTEPDPFGWEGRHYRFRTVAVTPRPLQPGGPKLLLSANSEPSARFAAEMRTDIGVSFAEVNVTAEAIQVYKAAAAKAGWTPDASNVLYRNYVLVAPDDEQAIEEARSYKFGDPGLAFAPKNPGGAEALGDIVGSSYGAAGAMSTLFHQDFSVPRFCGSPERVAEQLRAFHEIGVGHVDLVFGGTELPHDRAKENLALFAAEVLPRVREFESSPASA